MNACKVRAHRPRWLVIDRNRNYSAFNGYRYTPSDYSSVWCPVCNVSWRTRAGYVRDLQDMPR